MLIATAGCTSNNNAPLEKAATQEPTPSAQPSVEKKPDKVKTQPIATQETATDQVVENPALSIKNKTPTQIKPKSTTQDEITIKSKKDNQLAKKIASGEIGKQVVLQPVPIIEKSSISTDTHLRQMPRGKQVSQTASLGGTIRIVGKNNTVVSPENTIISLKPLFNLGNSSLASRAHTIDMTGKSFGPRFITINTNDAVRFKNNDKFKHNVFSSSGDNSFDLGTYGSGKSAGHTFKHEGIVKVYCNIHPNMAAFISVSKHNITQVLGKDGSYQFNDLIPGDYEITVWNIRGETKEIIEVTDSTHTERNITINTEHYKFVQHKNKFGKEYKKTSSLFEDEFY